MDLITFPMVPCHRRRHQGTDSEPDITSEAEDLVWRDTTQAFENIFLAKDTEERDVAAAHLNKT